ncbi:GNAT family N-acetyltransferase [Flavobacteriaceae bacterium F89]|uniref:GNAT family N-acetyltransferase n=1 Tax=Cerina litoralis TaxID=2874477 RepID=A0AAE3ERU7_9FLAO|nr:GNAT family N-acetyltransferase [Cerina litoralis]MCG2459228.1 GNAT family N-acetyltransferase [Cerina litoralis]
MNLKYKEFEELTTQELYDILRLRSEVFVVEQHCVYQDLDGKDGKAVHVLGTKNGILVAYTRIFGPGDYFKEAAIGRVLVKKKERKHGYGKIITAYSVNVIRDKFKSATIRISAQKYLEKFYSSLGFTTVGEGYLEDGIPHIAMFME